MDRGLRLNAQTHSGLEARTMYAARIPRLPVVWCGFYFSYWFANSDRALHARPEATP